MTCSEPRWVGPPSCCTDNRKERNHQISQEIQHHGSEKDLRKSTQSLALICVFVYYDNMIRFIIIIHCVPCVENYRGREKDVLESAIIAWIMDVNARQSKE